MLLCVPVWFEITGTILTVVLNGVMVAVAIASAIYAYKAYIHQKDRSKKDAACELAQYYADVILEEYRLILDVFRASGFDKLVKDTINIDSISKFDVTELAELTEVKKLRPDVYMMALKSIDPHIILNSKINNSHTLAEREKVRAYITYFDSLPDEQKECESAYIINEFMQEIVTLMNHLEWFCMKCSYGLAEEELIYRSLHQTFLSIVCQVYPFISSRNKNIEEKFFTNIIWLFGQWHKRVVEIKKIADEKKKSYEQQLESLCNSTPLK